tara:strand:+ start:8554 stop:8763 length:210 start_codon:yes stop_codon:yes gene_type:complete
MSNKIEVNPTFENILEALSVDFAQPRSVAREGQTCVTCGGSAKEFKNAVSAKEYTLSGMCQVCQDKFFE